MNTTRFRSSSIVGLMVVGLVVGLGISLCTSVYAKKNKDSEVAIKVDGESISKAKFNKQVKRRMNRMKKRMQRPGKSTPSLKKIRPKIKQRLRKKMINRLILKSHAQQSDVTVNKKEVDKEWNKFVRRVGSEKMLKKKLRQAGKSPEKMRSMLRDKIKVKKFIESKTGEVTVTDEELRNYYKRNKRRFKNTKFERIKPRLKKRLRSRKKRRKVQKLVSRLKKESDISVNV
ncbi:MAG: SurA N-terminal domain-containing protein [bacterium]